MRRFHTEVDTHMMLLSQISDSIREKHENTSRVGSIFKLITGNLDASDGKYFTDSINKLNRDQNQIENLLKNQISVTSSVVKS